MQSNTHHITPLCCWQHHHTALSLSLSLDEAQAGSALALPSIFFVASCIIASASALVFLPGEVRRPSLLSGPSSRIFLFYEPSQFLFQAAETAAASALVVSSFQKAEVNSWLESSRSCNRTCNRRSMPRQMISAIHSVLIAYFTIKLTINLQPVIARPNCSDSIMSTEQFRKCT